jgi:hypothetical protein
MYRSIVTAENADYLLPLVSLVDQIGPLNVAFWRLRDIELIGSSLPLGLDYDHVKATSRNQPNGLEVSGQEFQEFLKGDFQIIDGVIEAWSGKIPATCILRLDCEDASQWEITTDQPEIASKLEQAGFKHVSVPEQR